MIKMIFLQLIFLFLQKKFESMLYQIIYVSKRNCSEEEIYKILDKS